MYENAVVKLYRADRFSSWSTRHTNENGEEAYFIKVITEDGDLYYMLGSSDEAFYVVQR